MTDKNLAQYSVVWGSALLHLQESGRGEEGGGRGEGQGRVCVT